MDRPRSLWPRTSPVRPTTRIRPFRRCSKSKPIPGKFPSRSAWTRPILAKRPSRRSRPSGWMPSFPRAARITGRQFPALPGDGFPKAWGSGIECAASFIRNADRRSMPKGRKRWSRSSGRSNRGEASRSSSCGGGLAQVQGAWALICTGHSLLKLWKAAPP
jgi:hypothetical protein